MHTKNRYQLPNRIDVFKKKAILNKMPYTINALLYGDRDSGKKTLIRLLVDDDEKNIDTETGIGYMEIKQPDGDNITVSLLNAGFQSSETGMISSCLRKCRYILYVFAADSRQTLDFLRENIKLAREKAGREYTECLFCTKIDREREIYDDDLNEFAKEIGIDRVFCVSKNSVDSVKEMKERFAGYILDDLSSEASVKSSEPTPRPDAPIRLQGGQSEDKAFDRYCS